MRGRTARLLLAGGLALVAAAGPSALVSLAADTGEGGAPGRVVTTLRDERIDESSGLVVRDGVLFTVNDSGDAAVVYTVDLRSGRTTAVSTYDEEEPEDVEALAEGRGGRVWVGDIGDNRRTRGSVVVHRLRPRRSGDGPVRAQSFRLTYPDRQHDAEALLVHPRTGRLLVVTKRLTGGGVYRAPARLRPGATHELERVGRVPGLVTGGTFLPGGRRLLLRTYGGLAVYTYPGLELVASAELPPQEQGEAVAIGPDGRAYVTSEGTHSQVLSVPLPRPPRDTEEPDATPGAPDRQPPRTYQPEPFMGLGPWGLAGAAAVGLVGLGLLRAAVRAARRRGRRTP